MVYAWYSMCMVYAWCVHGVCLAYAWCMHGICMAYAWCVHGVCMVRAWYMHVYAWYICMVCACTEEVSLSTRLGVS